MTDQPKPQIATHQKLLAIVLGLVPCSGGVLVLITSNLLYLVVAGVILCTIAAAGFYALSKPGNLETAKARLVVNLILFPIYYAFAAIIVYYGFLHRR